MRWTIGKLRNLLDYYPDKMEVVIASDEEGNSFGDVGAWFEGEKLVLCSEGWIDYDELFGDVEQEVK